MTATRGARAEALVVERLREVLPPGVELLHNVHWLLKDHGRAAKGEADVVVGDPERGILVLEVKSGEIRRDEHGTWWAGANRLDRPPFQQASDSRYALVRKLQELPAWPTNLKPIAGEAVALPDVDLDTMRGRLGLLGLEAEHDLIADQSSFAASDDGRRELRAFIDRTFDFWSAKSGEQSPGEDAIRLLHETLFEPFEIRSLLRYEIQGGESTVVTLTEGQYQLLNMLAGVRRAAIVGGAGTGKTMLAAEKARRLARQGFRTLLICFNAPLARMLTDETAEVAASTGLLDVTTFHQLCQDLGREADVLGERPDPVPQSWWNETLPTALLAAVEQLGPRYHAIVVDEGQDFAPDWLLALEALSFGGREDVLYVFHDPAQAIYREDVVGQLGLQEYTLGLNCRNAGPIHRWLVPFAQGGLETVALREDGREPEFIQADSAETTVEALRKVLHRLRVDEDVPPWQVAVLTGARLEDSAVWRQRRFGNEVLDNPAVDGEGRHLGRAAHETPDLPSDAILCDTIRRFKGLERPVIILVELDGLEPARLERLLYVGGSRARQHLVVIGPAGVLGRVGR